MDTHKSKNIFLCVTEYHILLSILISSEVYSGDEYDNAIILCDGGRFKNPSIYDLSPAGNITYQYLDEKDFVLSGFIEEAVNECTGSLFLFNLNYPQFIYLAYQLKGKGVPASLVQDGLALYVTRSYTLREKMSNRRWSYVILHKTGIKDIKFLYKSYGWKGFFGAIFQDFQTLSESSIISYIWLTSPGKAPYAKSKVKSIPEFSKVSTDRTRSFFKFDSSHTTDIKKNDFLFVDQRIDGTSEFIKELSQKFPTSSIYIKLHPRSPMSWASDFEDLPNVKMIKNMKGIPLELLIQILSGVIVVSAYSSALLMRNLKCKFYYLYPWFSKRGYGKGEFEEKNIFNPTNHIKVIKDLDEIELFM